MSNNFDFGGEIMWRPSAETIAQSNLARFMQRHHISTFDELLKRSTDDIAWFWDTMLREMDIRFERPYSKVVEVGKDWRRPKWCVGGRMNIVTNLLDRYEGTPTDLKIAIRSENEAGEVRTLTYQQLRKQVNKTANALRSLGLAKGDAIGVFMPMNLECVIAMLSIIKIGGIFLPLFSGYGASACITRLVDADAKALFTADGCTRRGKAGNMKAVADEAAMSVPTLRHMIMLRQTTLAIGKTVGEHWRDHWWHELIESQSDVARTESTDAEDTCMLIYTSGTTGKPKGAVHTHCGFPIKTAQDMLHGPDVQPDEVFYWMSDMGWMMGPWLVFGTLLLGATMVCYDGAPDYPDVDRLWELVEKHRITALGISPTLIRALLTHGEAPVKKHDVSSLRKFASSGEPWNPEPWKWLFNVVGGGKLPIINYSGGTEISGGILSSNVILPMKPCAFAGALPGMDADVVDESGKSVRDAVGELVVRKPWIGMTRGFWKDSGDKRYEDAYFSRLEGLWVHGDFAAIDADNQWYILGRSDDTIKIAGKRLGPAEVESILVAHPDVKEAAAIGVPDEIKGQSLICFCVLKREVENTDALRADLKQSIAREMGKPLTPKAIKFVLDLPKTRNAKLMRRVIRCVYLGDAPGDVSSLENPRSLDEIRQAK